MLILLQLCLYLYSQFKIIMLEKLEQHDQIVREVRQQYSDKYYDTSQLQTYIQSTSSQIDQLLNQHQQHTAHILQRKQVLNTQLSTHPLRENIQLTTIHDQGEIDYADQLRKIIKPNTQIIVNLHLQEFIPILHKRKHKKQINLYKGMKVNIVGHHLQHKCQVPNLIIQPNSKLVNEEHIQLKREGIITIKHTIREYNYELMISLLTQQYMHIYAQTQHNLILGECKLKLTPSLINHKGTQYLYFHRCLYKQQFIVKAQANIQINVISPQLSQIRRKIEHRNSSIQKLNKSIILHKHNSNNNTHNHSRSKSPSRIVIRNRQDRVKSRSPSPIAKKEFIRSLKANSIIVIHVLDGYELNIGYSNMYESRVQPIYEHQHNIHNKDIQAFEDVLHIRVSLKQPKQQGVIVFRIAHVDYQLVIKSSNIFRVLQAQESRQIFKNAGQDYNMNCIIRLTQQILIYPNMKMKVIQNQIQQSAVQQCLNPYFLKSQVDHVLIQMPVPFQYKKAQNGYMIYYIVKGVQKGTMPISVRDRDSTHHELHFFTYQTKDMKVQVHKQMQVSGRGIYELDTVSLLKKKTQYRIRSLNQDIIYIVDSYLTSDYAHDYILLQLLTQVQDQAQVILVIDDLNKKISSVLQLKLLKRNRNINFGFK